MSLTIQTQTGVKRSRAFTHSLADIPGGGCIVVSELTQSTIAEGTPVGKDSNGKWHVVKTAELAANAANDATTYVVKKGHNLKVGDVIMAKTAGKAYAITAIADNVTSAANDDITVGTTLGVAVSAGDVLMQAAAAGASGSAFKYAPLGLVNTSYDVEPNLCVAITTIGQVEAAKIPTLGATVKGLLPLINFI